ncbi:MAG: AbrB/MazE/SpoVT family DNA-binding domain-containing protein [Candidatus Bathyarchaeota archaeon]|nr:AbrB/MazE/SpoVT family DNA-binding domain-containing protein [Candidatus Bathyarchaeota archaeon]
MGEMAEEREIQRGGRVTIPKSLRDRYGLVEGTMVRIRGDEDRILIEVPTRLSSLVGYIGAQEPSDDPKRTAREHARKQLFEDVE